MVQAKDPPSHYLTKLRTYLDPTASKSHRVSRKPKKIENSHAAKMIANNNNNTDTHIHPRVKCTEILKRR